MARDQTRPSQDSPDSPTPQRNQRSPLHPGGCAVVTTLALLIMVGGCSRQTPPDPPGIDPPPASPSVPADLPANVPTDLGAPIKSFRFDDGHNHRATLDLYALRRFDANTVQTWALLTRDPTSARDMEYGAMLTRAWNEASEGTSQPDGFALLDVAHQRLHAPMERGFDSVCGPSLHAMEDTVEQAYVTCLFGRPDTDHVDVHVQNFGSVTNVPVP